MAQQNTRSMDAKIQKMQETLMKGLIPLVRLARGLAEAIDGKSELPDKATLWDLVSNSVVLIASTNHELVSQRHVQSRSR